MTPDLDHWLARPALCVHHRRESPAAPDRLWEAAQSVRLSDTRMLGRLVRWRIPGIAARTSFDEMFRAPPFTVLCEGDQVLMSGLVGKIWTLRRDYPDLQDPEDFRTWSARGTVRVLFANWTEPAADGRSAIVSESRIKALGADGRLGLTAVRPFVTAFQNLVASDAMQVALRRAENVPSRKPR
jgi:hypothetical protein